VIIRDALPADLPAIFEIYDDEVLRGTATFDTIPKSPDERAEWFDAHPRDRYPVLVLEDEWKVAAWARLYPWSPRPAYARSAENAVYVHKDQRGRRFGHLILRELLARAASVGICVVVAKISDNNAASLKLHESLGFRTIGVMERAGEKFGRILDVRLMQIHLDQAPGIGMSPPVQP
jgi:phosphinothricin acetyltransferase